jgi:hypothetical protein
VNNTEFNFNGTAVFTSGAGLDSSNVATTAPTATEVRISEGSITDNTVAFFQQNPGTNQSAIWLRQGSNSFDPHVNIVGNGNSGTGTSLSTGSGTGCCSIGQYSSNGAFNLY